MTEKEVADQLDISTVPVRDAFQMLQHDGWIERVPYKGARIVNLLDQRVLQELFATRHVIEVGAVFRAAKLVEVADIDRLQKIVETYDTIYSVSAIERVRLEMQFHGLIVKLGTGSRIMALFEPILLQCYSLLELRRDFAYKVSNIKELHRIIVDALAEGDASCAMELTYKHIEAAYLKFSNFR